MLCKSVTNAHNRNQVLGMIGTPSGDLATIGLNGYLNVWTSDGDQLKTKKQIRIPSPYLHCFTQTSIGISLGTAEGMILFLDPDNFKVINKIKMHSDLPTNLIEIQSEFISAGIDGVIKRFTKQNFEVIETIRLNSPIWKMKLFENNLYVCCDFRSFIISNFRQKNRQIQQTSCKQNGFQQFQGQLFCYNQSCIKSISSGKQIADGCDYLVSHSSKLFAVRNGQIGVVSIGEQISIQWYQIPELQQGYQIRNSVQILNNIYLSGDAGNIYTVCQN